MTRGEKAKELFLKGYNCSQAVVGAFADDLDVDFDSLIRLSSSFGGGMGRMRRGLRSCYRFVHGRGA